MAEEWSSDSNVTHLPSRQPAKAAAWRPIREEISQLLDEAAPLEPPATAVGPPGTAWLPESSIATASAVDPSPPPGHRNAITCPQCDEWTWRATRECRHCGFDLFDYFEWQEGERQRQRRKAVGKRLGLWGASLALTGFALIYVSPYLPQPFRAAAIWLGAASMISAAICGKAIPPA